MITDSIIEQIRQKNSLLPFCESLSWKFKKIGGEHYTSCPFHQDGKRPNLRVNETKQIWFCDVCNVGGDVFKLAMRLDNSTFPDAVKKLADRGGVSLRNKRSSKFVSGEIVALYDYTDEHGTLVFQTVRLKPKDFRQRRPDGKGKWIWNLKDIQTVLYRLPEVLMAIKKRRFVFVTEGEKDCDSMGALGFVATTCPMGAGKWQDHYSEMLLGAHVILLPDNDDKGHEHTQQVGRSLLGKAATVKILTLPDLPPKGDVSDFIATFKDPAQAAKKLKELVDTAETFSVAPDLSRVMKVKPPCTPVDFAQWSSVIEANFPLLVRPAEVCLSVVAQLLLNDVANPFALALVDVPSSGKTITLNFFDVPELTYTTDSFTPAAFVSHASNVKREELATVDMLPRIRYRTLIVRDLAPIFGANDDDLIKSLGILTRALDGEGLETDSGVHGRRGYKGDYLFMLLAGTTPIPPRVFKVMGNLGSRLFFLALHSPEQHDDELMAQNRGVTRKLKESACKTATDNFLRSLWTANPKGVDWDKAGDPDECLRVIARCAKLLARLRGAINVWHSDDGEKLSHSVPVIEQPNRINCLFYNLARAHALVCGRRQLNESDLAAVLDLTFDSAPSHRANVFRHLIEAGGVLNTSDVVGLLGCSAPTARKEMEALSVLGVADKTKEADPENGRPETEITLATKFNWFATEKCQQLRQLPLQGGNAFLTPHPDPEEVLKAKQLCVGADPEPEHRDNEEITV